MEWEHVLYRAKQPPDLTEVFELLPKWRHLTHAEHVAPGIYLRLLAKSEQITGAGQNPDAVPLEDMQAVIRQRLGQPRCINRLAKCDRPL
ncbi:hypothetical protein A8926_0635 [Saccharopolyspora spinosa]|uniref:Uncharacterized protein n=1 Tax=Saccharopolyspora spinosa TaxID=60894 RepID=A0A2N3XR19_SACSN|nr:DUF6247 family protein [Saccharopolyspora spinosa]PKW13128.1 hypothetical protein A8926_0635 [Saccharopolyspora spinosa]